MEEDRHVTRKILRVACAPFGGDIGLDDPKGEISNTPEEIAAAERLLFDAVPGAAPRLAVHPGTTWNTKRMDPAFWAESVRLLRGTFPSMGTFLSWGTDREREECLAIRALAGGRVKLLPRLGYKALAAVYRACGHMIGPDTGPLHLAAVVGAKTVSVFRATDGNRNAPVGPDHRFLQASLPCAACLRRECPRDTECRTSIRPGEVAAAMAGLMAGDMECAMPPRRPPDPLLASGHPGDKMTPARIERTRHRFAGFHGIAGVEHCGGQNHNDAR